MLVHETDKLNSEFICQNLIQEHSTSPYPSVHHFYFFHTCYTNITRWHSCFLQISHYIFIRSDQFDFGTALSVTFFKLLVNMMGQSDVTILFSNDSMLDCAWSEQSFSQPPVHLCFAQAIMLFAHPKNATILSFSCRFSSKVAFCTPWSFICTPWVAISG